MDLGHGLRFDWDPAKAAINLQRHPGVSFEEAATVFTDPNAITLPDILEHEALEERLATLGYSARGRLLFVVHTMRGALIRLISARKPTRQEVRYYEEGWPPGDPAASPGLIVAVRLGTRATRALLPRGCSRAAHAPSATLVVSAVFARAPSRCMGPLAG